MRWLLRSDKELAIASDLIPTDLKIVAETITESLNSKNNQEEDMLGEEVNKPRL